MSVKARSILTNISRIPFNSFTEQTYLGCQRCYSLQSFSVKYKIYNKNVSPFRLDLARHSTTQAIDGKENIFSRMWQGLGFTGRLKYNKYILRNAGLRLYLCCVELVDYEPFFKELSLPDTFNSWTRITELHVWMIMTKLAPEGKTATFVRNFMLKMMWEDMDKRTKKLGQLAGLTARKEGLQEVAQQFKSSLFAYDEGILSDDRVLAGALWRNFFEMNCDDPKALETMVQYVRKQMAYIDSQDINIMLRAGLVTWLPLHGDTENSLRTKQILREIAQRS